MRLNQSAMPLLAQMSEVAAEGDMTQEHRLELLRLAREAILEFLEHGQIPVYKPDDLALEQPAGVFVTLRLRDDTYDFAEAGYVARPTGRLRGCVGHVEADLPLFQAVQEMAVKSATRDPRFPPLSLRELDDLHIEISVLSPFRRVTDIRQIEIGVHGLMIEKGGYRGLLLPVVPTSRGWDREQFLENLCRKAGLPPDAWREQADLYAFMAEEFGEETSVDH